MNWRGPAPPACVREPGCATPLLAPRMQQSLRSARAGRHRSRWSCQQVADCGPSRRPRPPKRPLCCRLRAVSGAHPAGCPTGTTLVLIALPHLLFRLHSGEARAGSIHPSRVPPRPPAAQRRGGCFGVRQVVSVPDAARAFSSNDIFPILQPALQCPASGLQSGEPGSSRTSAPGLTAPELSI